MQRSKLILLTEQSGKALWKKWHLNSEKMTTNLSGKEGKELIELSTQRERSKQSHSTEQEQRENSGG